MSFFQQHDIAVPVEQQNDSKVFESKQQTDSNSFQSNQQTDSKAFESNQQNDNNTVESKQQTGNNALESKQQPNENASTTEQDTTPSPSTATPNQVDSNTQSAVVENGGAASPPPLFGSSELRSAGSRERRSIDVDISSSDNRWHGNWESGEGCLGIGSKSG
jgi:hypothetical protein